MIVNEFIDLVRQYSDYNLTFYFQNKETNLRRVLNIAARPIEYDSIQVIDLDALVEDEESKQMITKRIKEVVVRLK